jgi:hypothetical protein
LPVTTLFPSVATRIPFSCQRFTARPLIVEPPAVIDRPSAAPAFAPESSIRITALLPRGAEFALEPGCV